MGAVLSQIVSGIKSFMTQQGEDNTNSTNMNITNDRKKMVFCGCGNEQSSMSKSEEMKVDFQNRK